MPLNEIAPNGRAVTVSVALAALCMLCAPSLAQSPESNSAPSASNPIEIKADSVERDDQNRTAIFRGNAFVTLGDMRLAAREIYVTYRAITDKTASTEPASMSEASEEITRLNAKGDVLVTMKNKTQAKSESANFDVKKQQLTMSGEVILSHDGNSVRGKELMLNVAAGVISMVGSSTPSVHDRLTPFSSPQPYAAARRAPR